MFQILINREEKENFFFKILKMEKRKRMKIQFFRARGSERGQYFSRFLEIRDSCPCLHQRQVLDENNLGVDVTKVGGTDEKSLG